MENKITNMEVYNARMEKSILDKLFFVDKIYGEIDAIVDFGCANGALIKVMKMLFPEYRYIGYDINEEMIKEAREQNDEVVFFSDWEKMMEYMKDNGISPDKTVINISSVIHEVYSYGNENDIETFWKRIMQTGFKYIAIRDMIPEGVIRQSFKEEEIERLKEMYPEQIKDFEKIWGPVDWLHEKNVIHFLLKYKYTENWEREVKENYFPLNIYSFSNCINQYNDLFYKTIYQENYVLPYVYQQVEHDTGIKIKQPTHLKILLKKSTTRH